MVNDHELILHAQSGDEQAFAELMRAYYAYVYTIVIGIVNNPHDAEEVVQDAFLNAYRGLAQLEDTAKFKSWLAEIARNRARDRLRKQRVDTVPIDEVGEYTLQNPDSLDEQLIRDEQRELIRRAMDTLPEKDREIARSYYLDGASYDELIQTHGLSYKAISFRLSRAKRRLAKRLEHLLTGIFVSPATTLKQIYSGGLTVMKIGTAPKITIGVIGIITLLFIGFIGSRQLLSSKDNRSASVEAVAPTADTTAQSVAQTDATRQDAPNTPSPEKERPISAKEMQEIVNLFTQLDEADVQSETDTVHPPTDITSDQNADERDTTEPSTTPSGTTQSAEDVMNTYLEAFRNFDVNVMLTLQTERSREVFESNILPLLGGELPEDVVGKIIGIIADLVPEEKADQMRHLAPEIIQPVLYQMLRQPEIVNSEYVDDEFHFRLRTPPPEIPGMPGVEIPEMPKIPDLLLKMQKTDGAWMIYEIDNYDIGSAN